MYCNVCIFLRRHLHVLIWSQEERQTWNSPTSKQVDTARTRDQDGGDADDVYLPTSRISAEIAKRRCKPSVDFVKRQLLLGGLSYCLERRQSPVLLSRLPLEFCAKMNWWELFAFSKSWQSELGSQEGLTLPSKLSLLFLIWSPQSLAATYDAVRQGCASMMTRPLYLYTVPYMRPLNCTKSTH